MQRVSLLILCSFAAFATGRLPCSGQEEAAKQSSKEDAVPAKIAALELEVPETALKDKSQAWYGLYINGAKSGWGTESRQPETIDGKAVVVSTMQMHMEMKAQEQEMKMDFSNIWRYSTEPPYRLIYLEEKQEMKDQMRKVVLKHREGTTYDAEITEAGRTSTEVVKDFDLRLTHDISPELWILDPARKPGDAVGERGFSSDIMSVTDTTTTLLSESEWAGPGGKLPIWECSIYDHEHGITATGRISKADGAMVTAVFGGLFELRAEPEKVAKQSAEGGPTDIFQAMTISCDRKLGRSTSLAELVIEITAPEGKNPPKIPDTANQTAEVSADGKKVTVRIGAAHGKPQPVSDEERAKSLQATRHYPAGEAKVKELAQKAVEGAETDEEKVKKLLRFTDRFVNDSFDTEPLTVMDLIENPHGDCSAHSLLFTTLARAAGIPAREAGGWMYMGNEYKSFGGHAWNEVILDGKWTPVDPTWTQMRIDAGHIQLHAGDALSGSVKGFVPGLKAKVLSSKKK